MLKQLFNQLLNRWKLLNPAQKVGFIILMFLTLPFLFFILTTLLIFSPFILMGLAIIFLIIAFINKRKSVKFLRLAAFCFGISIFSFMAILLVPTDTAKDTANTNTALETSEIVCLKTPETIRKFLTSFISKKPNQLSEKDIQCLSNSETVSFNWGDKTIHLNEMNDEFTLTMDFNFATVTNSVNPTVLDSLTKLMPVLGLNIYNVEYNHLINDLKEEGQWSNGDTEFKLEIKTDRFSPYYFLTIHTPSKSLFAQNNVNYQINPNLIKPETTIKEENKVEEAQKEETTTNTPSTEPTDVVEQPTEVVTDSKTILHFIDTGQSDSILIENNGKYALIDSGDCDDDYTVKSYLRNQGVTRLEYLIITHYHADHFGGADTVVRDFEVGTTFVPNGDADTQVYRDFITALSNKGLAGSVPLEGKQVPLGNATLTFYNTRGGHSNENNNSLVVLLESGNKRALFTGDAEAEIERTLNIGDVDLFKVGHHGSNTSNSQSFINQIKPEYAVVMVGEDNKYGHPHQEVMNRFESLGIPVYRTDEQGHIVATLTNDGITFNIQPGSYNPGSFDYSSSDTSSSSNSSSPSNSSNTSSSNNTSSNTSQPSTSTPSSGGVKVYQNCKLLNQDYPHGINKWDHPELYEANTGRDRDKDGYACEK